MEINKDEAKITGKGYWLTGGMVVGFYCKAAIWDPSGLNRQAFTVHSTKPYLTGKSKELISTLILNKD